MSAPIMPRPLRFVQQSPSSEIRKRVRKACDRCRFKKSKCDGARPCHRCKADNAICEFGVRKRSHDKIHAEGYVEMLEQQQSQLVSALQDMYKRLQSANAWDSATLAEANGRPLVHDILVALNLFEVKQDDSSDMESFEDDCPDLQNPLFPERAVHEHGRCSFNPHSDQSRCGPPARNEPQMTPTIEQIPVLRDSGLFILPASSDSSPVVQSAPQVKPLHRQAQSCAVQSPGPTHSWQHRILNAAHYPSQIGLPDNLQLYRTQWAMPDTSTLHRPVSPKMHFSAMQQPKPLFQQPRHQHYRQVHQQQQPPHAQQQSHTNVPHTCHQVMFDGSRLNCCYANYMR